MGSAGTEETKQSPEAYGEEWAAPQSREREADSVLCSTSVNLSEQWEWGC